MEDERFLYALLGVTVGCYAGIAGIAGLLFYWFNPSTAADCSFNVAVIVIALFVALVLGAASMHPAVSLPKTFMQSTAGAPVHADCVASPVLLRGGHTCAFQATNGRLSVCTHQRWCR